MNNIELEKTYRDFNEMFRSEGWKLLLEEVTTHANQANSIDSAKDERDLYFRKGQLSVFSYILGLENQIALAQEELDSDAGLE